MASHTQFEGEVPKAAGPFHVGLNRVLCVVEVITAQLVTHLVGRRTVQHVILARGALQAVAQSERKLGILTVWAVVAYVGVEIIVVVVVKIALVKVFSQGIHSACSILADKIVAAVTVAEVLVYAGTNIVSLFVKLVRKVDACHTETAVIVGQVCIKILEHFVVDEIVAVTIKVALSFRVAVIVVAHKLNVGHRVNFIANMGKYIAVQSVVLAVVIVSLGGGCVVGAVGDGVMVLPVGSLVPSLVARIIVASAGIQVYCQFLVGPGIRHPRRY